MQSPRLFLKVHRRPRRLLSGVAPFLIVSCPAMVLAQVAVNTARVAAPADAFETAPGDNEVTNSVALLAVLSAVADTYTGIRAGIGNLAAIWRPP